MNHLACYLMDKAESDSTKLQSVVNTKVGRGKLHKVVGK